MAKRKRNTELGSTSAQTNGHDTNSKSTSVKADAKTNGKSTNLKSSTKAKAVSSDDGPRKVLKTENHVDVKSEVAIFQIVAGSYERVLHGITAVLTRDGDQFKTTFSDSFLFNAHASAIRCLALSPMPEDSTQGVLLATGGSDERINVYSLSAAPVPETDSKGRLVPAMPSLGPNKISENPMNRELGTLVQHSASVSALHFPSRSKLLSAAEDNTISITRVRDLEVVSTVKAPKPKASGQASGDSAAADSIPSGVNDFAVHSSMKLMVSVGRGERCMRLWNLVTGKKAGVLNFDRNVLQAVKESKYSHGEGRRIKWNSKGSEFSIAFERGVVVFGQDSKAKCVLMPSKSTKVHQIIYFAVKSEDFLAVSTDDGKILFFNTQNLSEEETLPTLNPFAFIGGQQQSISARLKDFQLLNLTSHGFEGHAVAIGCSNGDVKVIMIKDSELLQPEKNDSPIGQACSGTYSTGSRITCLVGFVMLPPHDIEGGLSEAESVLGSDSEDS